MSLSRSEIIALIRSKQLVVDPLTPGHLQIAGVQLSLGPSLARMRPGQVIDPLSLAEPAWEVFEIDRERGYQLPPGGFLLGHTLEKLTVPAYPTGILAMIDGRSTVARCGVTPHQAAMAIWPGHGQGEKGPRQITLEIKNQGDATVVLRPGWFVANMTFHRVENPEDNPYDKRASSKYRSDQGIMLPKFNGEFVDLSQIVRPEDLA